MRDDSPDRLREWFGRCNEPYTAAMLARRSGLDESSVTASLTRLVDQGHLETKTVGADTRVWWRPPPERAFEPTAETSTDEVPGFDSWLDGVLDHALDCAGVGVVAVDAHHRVTDVNDTARSLLGLGEPGAARGTDLRDQTAVGESVIEAVEAALDGRGSVVLEAEDGTNGSSTWVEYTVVPHGTGTVIVLHDVSDRERLQRELRTETEQLRTALRNSPLVAFRLDTDLRYTWVGNPHEDFDPAAVIGKRDDELLPPEAADVVMAPKRRVIETGEGVREEVTYELPSGQVTYDLTVEPLRDESGDLVGLTSAALDITAQKRRERQLREQNERLDRVTTVLSHDLRSPLSVATGRLALFERDSDPAHLDDVRTALVRMSDLVDDVLAAARRQGDGDERETSTVPVRDVAERAWEQVETDGASLVVETDRTAEADESRLQQLFENLFRNSVEHGLRGDERNDGSLTVRVGPLADGGFFVEDNGTGFVCTPSEVEQAFEDGYTTRPEGTGLGLGIIRDVTAEHGWTVEAVAENDGARFEFRVD